MKKLILASALALPIVALAAPSTPAEKAGYSMGFQIGMTLHKQNQVVDAKSFEQGFDDGYSGKTPQLSLAEQSRILQQLQEKAMKQMAQKMKAEAASNATASEAFLAANAKKPGVVTAAGGLQYKVLTKGTGPSPTLNSTVTVSYTGMLANGKVFDASAKHGGPATFTLKNVIPGWQKLIPMMKQGGEWMLYIPPKYGYGKVGAPGLIGPNEALVFKVKLLKVK